MTDNLVQSSPPDHFLEQGRQKIRWAELHQQLLQRLRKQFGETQDGRASFASRFHLN